MASQFPCFSPVLLEDPSQDLFTTDWDLNPPNSGIEPRSPTRQADSLPAEPQEKCGRPGFNLWVGKIPWRRKWQPTPVLLPGKSHGRRILVGYSSWGGKKSDTTEQLYFPIAGSILFQRCLSFLKYVHFLNGIIQLHFNFAYSF